MWVERRRTITLRPTCWRSAPVGNVVIDREIANWSFVGALRHGVVNLFPTRKTKMALWGTVGLGVLTTYMELLAAQLFSKMITSLDVQSQAETALTLGGFLFTFGAIRGISYFQSVYRLTVLEKGLREVESKSAAAEAWRWPMAIGLAGMLGQVARLAVVTVTVASTAWEFGLLLLICTLIAVLIVNRTGRRQYAIHHEFAEAKKAGSPPTAAERIGTRIRAGERAGLVAIGPVLVYVAALGVGAANGQITTQSALVLFIAARMASNMYGSLSSESMRYIRAQVNVEVYDAGSAAKDAKAAVAPEPADFATDEDNEDSAVEGDGALEGSEPDCIVLHDALVSSSYLWEPPAQAFARLFDDGLLIGNPATLGRVGRERGFGPDTELRKLAPEPRPERTVATAPNCVWMLTTHAMPVETTDRYLHVLVDLFSRAIVRWRFDAEMSMSDIAAFVPQTCQLEGIRTEEVTVYVPGGILGCPSSLYDLLRSLGVVHSLIWTVKDADSAPPRPARPAFPASFSTVEASDLWFEEFVSWYNTVYYRADIGYLHPSDVHAGSASVITTQRLRQLDEFSKEERALLAEGYPDILAPPREARFEPGKIETFSRRVTGVPDTLDEEEDEAW